MNGRSANRFLLALAVTALALIAPAAASAASQTFSAVADTYVASNHANTNYGSATRMYAKYSSPTEHMFVKFDVSLPSGATVTGATLKLYSGSGTTPSGVYVDGVADNTWTESAITSGNAPKLGQQIGQSGGWSTGLQYISTTLANNSIQNGLNSVGVVRPNTSSAVQFWTKEAAAQYASLLVVNYTAPAPAPWTVRGLYISWGCCSSELPTAATLGFNAVSVEPDRTRLDYIQSLGLKGLVWLGGYDNTTCSFLWSDDEVRTKVESINGDPDVLAYEIDNEPHASCPTAPQDIKNRVALVRSLVGPNIIVYITLSKDFAAFANTGVDLIRISAYPCSYEYGCVMQKIVDKVSEARAAGFTRMWAGTQTAGDSYYRPPTPDELDQIQQTWRDVGADGFVAWAWDGHGTTTPLRTNTALWPAWQAENAK